MLLYTFVQVNVNIAKKKRGRKRRLLQERDRENSNLLGCVICLRVSVPSYFSVTVCGLSLCRLQQ